MTRKGQVNSQERKQIPLDSTSDMRKNSFENNILERLDQIRDMIQVMATSVSNLSDYFIKEKILEKGNIETQQILKDITINTSSSVDALSNNLTQCLQNARQDTHKTMENEAIIITDDSEIMLQPDPVAKTKNAMINIWNLKLKKRRENFWQMIRNNNTAKIYEEWMVNSPIIIPKKLQIKEISGEPLEQTQRRERQCLDNYRAEKDLLELRAECHERQYKHIDQEMLDLIKQKSSGRNQEQLIKMWKGECVAEETNSLQRWEKSNAKFVGQYEKAFVTFYHSKNPLLKYDSFKAPTMGSLREKQKREHRSFNNSFTENGSQSLTENKIPSKTYAQVLHSTAENSTQRPASTNNRTHSKTQQEYFERNEYKTNNRDTEEENMNNNRTAGKHNNGNILYRRRGRVQRK